MIKREFLIEWLEREGCLTSYNMHPKVIGWHNRFYKDKSEKAAIRALTRYFRKFVDEGIVHKAHRFGLGAGSKIDFFGTTQQCIWNKKL